MINPLSKKNKLGRNQERSLEQSRVETRDEIFCRICKVKYSIGDYKQHMTVHRRQRKPPISNYNPIDRNISRETQVDRDSLYITHQVDIDNVAKLKGLFVNSLVKSQRSEQHERYPLSGNQMEPIELTFAQTRMRNTVLNKSQTLPISERRQFSSQNPEFKEAKGSIIDMLKTQRGVKHGDPPITPQSQGHNRKYPSLYESLMESLSQHRINSLHKIGSDKI